jgi:hypothetical protein
LVFGDGSKSDDATGLVACRFSDGFLFTLHHQQPSKDELVSRAAVDAAVVDMFDRYRLLGFWFDPSHAKADDAVDDDRFWWPLVDRWHAEYGKRLNRLWAVKSGNAKHAVAFDMLKPSAQQLFQPAVTQLAEDLEAGTALHHGGARLVQHMKNARRRDGRYGMSVGKESRSSARKIDLAVCAIGARLMRRQLLLADKKPGSPGQGRAVALD